MKKHAELLMLCAVSGSILGMSTVVSEGSYQELITFSQLSPIAFGLAQKYNPELCPEATRIVRKEVVCRFVPDADSGTFFDWMLKAGYAAPVMELACQPHEQVAIDAILATMRSLQDAPVEHELDISKFLADE